MKKQTIILSLVLLALLITVLGASAADTWVVDPACAATILPPACDNAAEFTTIPAAIAAAANGDTIEVRAGTYAGNLAINEELTLVGPNHGSMGQGARVAEAVIQGQVTITASNVTLSGFTLSNPGQTYGVVATNALSNLRFAYNIFTNIGSTATAQNVKGLLIMDGPDDVVIVYNLFEAIHAAPNSVNAIFIGQSPSVDASTGLVIKNNAFKNITSGGKGSYGIQINNGAGIPGAIIANNSFDGLTSGGWTHAIGLEGPSPNAQVVDNIFSNLSAGGLDNSAIFFEANPDGATVLIEGNRFQGSNFFGVAVHEKDLPGGANGLDYTVDATNNWWNDGSGPSDPGFGSGATGSGAFVGPQVTFAPWLTSQAIYDSIPLAYPGSFPSLGYAATSTDEFGDYIAFSSSERKLESVVVSMTNWACENDFDPDGSGGWIPNRDGYAGEACVSSNGSGFDHDVTLNIYEVDNTGSEPALGEPIATLTDTFFMYYRPSWDSVNCTATEETPSTYQPFGGKWYDPVSGRCTTGYAFDIEFDFTSLDVWLPDEVIFGVAYNTSNQGDPAIGATGPYDSLNFSLASVPPSVGTDVEADAIFWDTSHAPFYTDGGAGGVDIFRRDDNWAPYVPAVEFYATADNVSTAPADDLLLCGEGEKVVTISLGDVANLYTYQFDVSYDEGLVEEPPVPAFVNGWFTTGNPFGSKSCSGGSCSFVGSRQLPDKDGVYGSGQVASITLKAAPGDGGTFPLTFSNLVLSTRDGEPIAADLPTTALQVTVCGQATVTGQISLQGRFSGPLDPGTVTFTELDGNFTAPAPVPFDAAGNYSVTLDVLPTGSNYSIEAAHGLYISNKLATYSFVPGANSAPNTQLRAGDANLQGDPEIIGPPYSPPKDQLVEIYDLQCISDGFGPGDQPCGGAPAGSSSNINLDSVTNAQDLALAAGNFDRYSFRDWLTPDFP